MGRVFGGLTLAAAAVLASASLAACGGKKSDDGATAPSTTSKAQAFSGKAHVVGTLNQLFGARVSLEPIAAPFTFTVPDAGRGGLDLPKATVNGQSNAIIWSGGRPLPTTGTCGLDVGDADMTVDQSGAHIQLDNQARAFTKGTCTFGSSVAVGSHGLSSPQPSVTFTLPSDADFSTSGGATVTVPADRRYEGHPGSKVGLMGPMRVETETDEFDASAIGLTSGTWVVVVTKDASGALHFVADLEGELAVNRAK